MMTKRLFASVLAAGMLSACAQNPDQSMMNKQNVGMLLGAGAGAIGGAQFGKGSGKYAAIAAGTLLGGMLGSSIGQSLDNMDRNYHEQTAQRALETGRSGTSMAWNNPDNGHSGTITPVNVVDRGNGMYCREYRQTIVVDGRTEQGYGTACRQSDGSWRIQS